MSLAIFDGLFRRFDHAEIARHDADLRGGGEFLGFDLVAHRLDGARIGADEDDAGRPSAHWRKPRARRGSHSRDAPLRRRSACRRRRSCRSADRIARPAADRDERPRPPSRHAARRRRRRNRRRPCAMPIFFAVLMMRQAISPRLAIKILRNMRAPLPLIMRCRAARFIESAGARRLPCALDRLSSLFQSRRRRAVPARCR